MKKFLAIFILLLIFVFPVYAKEYPQYTGYVNDFAHVLGSGVISRLDRTLSDFDKKTTNQIAVVTVDSTQPETIEEYSIHLAELWKPGQKGKDNGVIMLFAIQDKKMRIEVGRGLEGDLTDVQTEHIQTDIIRPELARGRYDAGIGKGVDAVIASLDKTASAAATPDGTVQPSSGAGTAVMIIFFIILIIVFIAISPYTPLGGQGTWGYTGLWKSSSGGDDGGGGTSFGGGSFSGGGSSSGW